MSTTRTHVTFGPFSPEAASDAPPWVDRGWACRWVAPLKAADTPLVVVYRCCFEIKESIIARVHVTADERYELFLDGRTQDRGPERGDPDNWFFETYDLPLTPGKHVLAARVWSLGALAPWAQRRVSHGLLVAPQDEALLRLIGTGIVAGVGPGKTIDAAQFLWQIESGEGADWAPASAGESGNDGFTLYPFRPAHRL